MAGTLETAGGMIGSAVVNTAAIAAAILILRSGRASDPRLIAGAMAYYVAVKQTGKLNGAEFGKALDDLLKKEYGILAETQKTTLSPEAKMMIFSSVMMETILY